MVNSTRRNSNRTTKTEPALSLKRNEKVSIAPFDDGSTTSGSRESHECVVNAFVAERMALKVVSDGRSAALYGHLSGF